MLNSVLSFLVALGILVFIHEYGHYAVARFFGVRVIRFSIGFGRPILRWTSAKTGVEWVVSWIPLGGYVRMLDENDPDSLQGTEGDLSGAFNRKPVLHRMAIVVAGPLANLLLAALLYSVLSLNQTSVVSTRVAAPESSTPAAMAGLQGGDVIRQVNGTLVQGWGDIEWSVMKAKLFGRDLKLDIERSGAQAHALVSHQALDPIEFGPQLGRQAGFAPHETRVLVRNVSESSAAQRAGLANGDVLLALDGIAINTAAQVTRYIQSKPGQPVVLDIERAGLPLQIKAIPEEVNSKDGMATGRLGMALGAQTEIISKSVSVTGALHEGVGRMVEVSVFSLMALVKMVTGGLSWTHLSGPVSIAAAAGESSSLGILPFIAFLAMVSVSLGVLNLLPVPLLDGGHLMYHFAELVRGKPVSERVQLVGQKIGLFLVAGLTFLALFNDLQRLL